MALSLSHRRDHDIVTVAADGEVDLATAPELAEEISTATDGTDTAEVVVDLSAVTFVDSAGISTLLQGRRQADEQGKRFRVTGASGLVREVLELTGVWQHLAGADQSGGPAASQAQPGGAEQLGGAEQPGGSEH